jgi:hypothetical protein
MNWIIFAILSTVAAANLASGQTESQDESVIYPRNAEDQPQNYGRSKHTAPPPESGFRWAMSGAFVTNAFNLKTTADRTPYFDFFQASTKQFDGYLLSPYNKPISGHLSMTVEVVTGGNPVFKYDSEPGNTCDTPATVRPFFWGHKAGSGEFDRWWSNPTAFVLTSGTATVTVGLTQDQWSSVYGKPGNYDAVSAAGFQQAISKLDYIGMTFGGGCFFGHGVNVSGGTAQFRILSFTTF